MTRENLIWLTKEVYRLTLLFPKKEPLRYKMREIADDILTECLRLNLKQELKQDISPKEYMGDSRADLEVLDAFFDVAKEQNWVSPEEILKLQENYSKLKDELKTETDLEMTLTLPLDKEKEAKNEFIMLPLKEDKSSSRPFAVAREVEEDKSSSRPFAVAREAEEESSISERQEKILAFLKEQGRAQVWQIKQVLPEVTKRTLRRDFENLLKKGLVERAGERNNTFYQVPSERGERRESNSLRTKITEV